MKSRKAVALLALLAILSSIALLGSTAEATIYTVNLTITGPLNGPGNQGNPPGTPLQTDSVVGTITTDGTIGYLHTGNISDWKLNLMDVTNPQYSYELTPTSSTINVDRGDVLSADATNLYFNFSGTNHEAFGFQAISPGPFSGYHYWCLNTDWYAAYPGNSIAPDHVFWGVAGDDLVNVAGTQGQVGNAPLDQNQNPSSVPEPGTMLLVGVGLAGLVSVKKRIRS